MKQWIGEGILAHGDALPSERELSQKLSVSRDTIRRAIRVLQSDGVIRCEGPRTRLVVKTESSGPSGWMQNAIVLVAPEGELYSGHRQPGWGEYLVIGATSAVRSIGKHVITLHPDLLTDSEVDRVLSDRPLGMVFPEYFLKAKVCQAKDLIPRFQAAGIPVITYGDSPELQSVDRVTSDHESGTCELTQWLIAQGRKRILPLWFGPCDEYWVAARRAGYVKAMNSAGLSPLNTEWMVPLPVMDPTADNFKVFSHYVTGYLVPHLNGPAPVDAIMAMSDGHVPYIAGACRAFGKVPNRDVLLVGYDNYAAELPELQLNLESIGPLATMDKRNFQMGQEMVNLLMDRVAGVLPSEPQRRVVKPQLIVLKKNSQ